MLRMLTWPLRYAISELRSEWVFGCGVALAICSVLTPTTLLWGVKTGMVESLRSRLLSDPGTRELVLTEGDPIGVDWFGTMRSDPRVGFIVPCVRQISLYGDALSDRLKGKLEVAYLPTATGDPLGDCGAYDTKKMQLPIPCMVTTSVAEGLGVGEGDEITLVQTREVQGQIVTGSFKASVRKVIPASSTRYTAVYLPLPVIERIEDFKDGRAVGAFEWERGDTPPMEIYDAFRIRPKDPSRWTHFAELCRQISRRFELDEPIKGGGAGTPEYLEFRAQGDELGYDEIEECMRLLSTVEPLVNLRVEPVNAIWEQSLAGKPLDVSLVSSDGDWLSSEELTSLLGAERQPSEGIGFSWFHVAVDGGAASSLELLLRNAPNENGMIEVSPRESGVLGIAKRRPVEFLASRNDLRPLRKEYLSFRLYAKNLEDVKSLRLACDQQGIQVSTQENRIAQVQALDKSLGHLFLFIALAGGVGGFGALFTSLYLSIERSKRQFAVLQILGIPTRYVLAATMLQGLILVFFGASVSFVLYQFGSRLLQGILGAGMAPGEAVCKLSAGQWGVALLASFGCSIFAALLSSKKLRIKDPAIVARSE